MEPRPETVKAAAGADKELTGLMARTERFMIDSKVERQELIQAGDIEGAKKIENAMASMNETIGLLRFNGYSSRFGKSALVPDPKHDARAETGKYAERGSQGHLTGELDRMEKATASGGVYIGVSIDPGQPATFIVACRDTKKGRDVETKHFGDKDTARGYHKFLTDKYSKTTRFQVRIGKGDGKGAQDATSKDSKLRGGNTGDE